MCIRDRNYRSRGIDARAGSRDFGPEAMTIFPGRQVPNRSQLEAYVEAELGKAVPSDWRVVREDPKRLWWLLQRVSILQGEWPIQDFSLLVSDDLQWLFFTHGNKDC